MSGGERVYPRDVSGHAAYHRGGRGHDAFAWHWPHPNDGALSACGKSTLYDDKGTPPDGVHPGARCGRPGCKQRWQRWEASRG